jgi:hypothetical protein
LYFTDDYSGQRFFTEGAPGYYEVLDRQIPNFKEGVEDDNVDDD